LPKAQRKTLTQLMRTSEAQAKPKPRANLPKQAPPPLVVRSIALTPAADETLARLIESARRRVGRKVSASSVVRALLEYCDRKGLDARIHAAIEAELNAGTVVWGSKRGAL
jgi:hypothetical protein